MWFAGLLREIDEVSIPADPRALRVALSARERLDAKIAAAIGDFDALGLFDETGATSTKVWLRDEGFAGPDAHRMAVIGKRMRELPVVAAAWTAGELSNGQVRAIVANLVDRHVDRFRDVADVLVPTLVGLGVDETNRVMVEWRARADALDDDAPSEPELALHHSKTFGDRYVTNGAFDAASGSMIAAALDVADRGERDVPASRRRAQALVDICSFFLSNRTSDVTARQRPHVSLIVDAADLTRGDDAFEGISFGEATISEYLCDCTINRIIAEKIAGAISRVLDLGRSTDTVSTAQRNALTARDRGCRYPGCDRPASWCDAHHVWWWSRGGPTSLDNLVLLCRRHHRMLHSDERMHAKLLPDATLVITLPNGTTRTSRPPGSLPLVA
ncbi:MAG TPA: DUF222 domain-containing protein [Acidimicrobiales bacterium]|jgi:hypothetical protein|nr:DUF222 domain-containing protein [Acidimicrobiales bacterium]